MAPVYDDLAYIIDENNGGKIGPSMQIKDLISSSSVEGKTNNNKMLIPTLKTLSNQ